MYRSNKSNKSNDAHSHKRATASGQKRRPRAFNPYEEEKQYVCVHRQHGQHGQHGGPRQQQQQQQVRNDKQAQVVARAQLLLDDVSDSLKMTGRYMEALNRGCSRKEAEALNKRVVATLVCLDIKVSGMRANAAKESISFKDAFKASKMQIREFEQVVGAKVNGNQACVQRLRPVLNYMRAVLDGREVPALPHLKNYDSSAKTASSVMNSFAYAMQTVIPNKMKDFARHSDKHNARQQRLAQQYDAEEPGEHERAQRIDYRHLVQDYQSEYTFAKSWAQQQAEHDAEMKRIRYKKPNLMDGDGSDSEHDLF